MFGSNFRDFVSGDSAEIKDERLTKSWHGFEKSGSGDSGNCSETEEEFEILDSDQRKPAIPLGNEVTDPKDLNIENELVANIGEGPKSFVVEPPQGCDGTKPEEKEGPVQHTSTLKRVKETAVFTGELLAESVQVGVKELGRIAEVGYNAMINARPIPEENQEDEGIFHAEDQYDEIKSLTFAEIVDALNKAKNKNNYKELDEIIGGTQQNNDDVFITDLSSANFRKFCSQYLNLHKYVYDNILSQYKLDKKSGHCNYSAKELVLLAIAANDKLTEKYKKTLFNQERDKDFDQLLIGVGGQEYIKILSEQLTTSLNRNVMAYGRVFNVLEAASFTQNTECVNAVLKLLRDIKPNNRESVGSTPLHFAVQFNDLEIIKILLDNKFDVNTVDSNSQTPLHFAVQRGSLEIVTLLVEKGAIVTEEIVRLANKQLKPVGNQEGNTRKIANFLIDKYTASNMEAPTQEPTENNNSNKFLTTNREEGKMGNSKKKQDTKSIQERLSDAIQQINYDAVKSIVERGGMNITKLVLSEVLDEAKTRKANLKKGGKKDKKKFDNQSQNIALIIILLQEKLDNIQIDSEPLNNSDRSKVKSNATANGQINTSHAQPIDPEVLKLVHNMVETVSDDQTPVGQSEGPSSGKGAGAADDNNNGTNPRVITFENGDEAVIEDLVEEENSGNVSTLESDSDQQDPQPKILVIDDKPHNVDGEGNDTPDNGEPDKTSKNAQKSKFPTIAVSTLLTTAVATETAALAMYFAFQASLLATGIVAAIGACCLVAALVIHCCKPSNSLEGSNVEVPTNSISVV